MKQAPVLRLDDMPDLLTMREVAALLRSGTNFPYQLAAEGKLRTIKLGKKMLAPKAALVRLIGGEE